MAEWLAVEIYRERVPCPGWFQFVLLVAMGVLGYAAAAMLARGALGQAAVPGVVLIILAIVFRRMRFIALEFGREGAAFGFGGLNRRVPRDRIETAAPEAYSVARYMGWGYRFGWQPRDRAYSMIGFPRGVRLVFLDERGRRWHVFLSSRDPEAADAALEP